MRRTVIMLLALALAAALVCVGCGGNGASSDSPEQVAEKLWQATIEEDADAAWELITADSQESIGKDELVAGASESIGSYAIGEATVSGDDARVETTLVLKGLDYELVFDTVLLKEDGAWKVSLLDTQEEINAALSEMQEELETPQGTGE